tara:strand:+ start:2498 stop:2737 length:240 start_codon:yes stop_codon:yes gene_type:complete
MADFDLDTVQVDNQIDRIQRSRLPFDNYCFVHLGNQRWRYIRILHFLEGRRDFPDGHAFVIDVEDFIAHRLKTPLMLFD